jgi:hypothetical protein
MGAVKARIKKLEETTTKGEHFVCLSQEDGETAEACIARHGYSDKPWVTVVLCDRLDILL